MGGAVATGLVELSGVLAMPSPVVVWAGRFVAVLALLLEKLYTVRPRTSIAAMPPMIYIELLLLPGVGPRLLMFGSF